MYVDDLLRIGLQQVVRNKPQKTSQYDEADAVAAQDIEQHGGAIELLPVKGPGWYPQILCSFENEGIGPVGQDEGHFYILAFPEILRNIPGIGTAARGENGNVDRCSQHRVLIMAQR